MLSEVFWDPEYSFVAVRRILPTIFAKQKFAQLKTNYVRRTFFRFDEYWLRTMFAKQMFAQLRTHLRIKMWLFDFGVMRPTPFSLGAFPQTLYPFLTKKLFAKCETLHGSQWLLQTKHLVIAQSTQQSFSISVMLWSSSAAYTDSKQTFHKNPCWNIQLNIDLLPLNGDIP